nr:spermidine synthase [Polymorphobacter sp.]
MIPRVLLATADIPGGGDLRLFKHGDDFMILLGRNELMNSRMSGSEEALASMTCVRLADTQAAHLLIGGYGMGFTLRKALATLGPEATVTVAELVPEIIDWARGPMAALTAGGLDDSRVRLFPGDVGEMITGVQNRYDAILLDVDNGPDGLVRDANNRLYSKTGLGEARAALRPGGVLAVWSAAPDPAFTNRLKRARFDVEEVVTHARANGKGPRHVIWFAVKR